jgi:hypothetical protein
MAITTQFDSNDYANTLKFINGEFISTYLSDVDITYIEPTIDENNPLTLSKPLIWLQYYGDDFSEVGMGRTLTSGKKGQLGTISFWIWYYVDSFSCSETDCLRLGANVKNIYLQHVDDLNITGIKNVRVSSLRSLGNFGSTIGARQLLTLDRIINW